MKRNIKLSEETQVLLNAILDLENLTSRVYESVRDSLQIDDDNDKTGEEILTASGTLRDKIEYYLRDRFNFSVTLPENQEEVEVVL